MSSVFVLFAALASSQVQDPGVPGGFDQADWQQHAQEAAQYAQKGDMQAAIASCEKAIELGGHYSSHHLLSQIYLAQADHHNALHHMKKAADLEPSMTALKAGVKFHEAILAQVRGDFAAAHALLKESASQGEELDVQTLEKLAIAAASLGDIPLAVGFLKRVWKAAPAYHFHNNLPFVRIADLYEEQLAMAEEEGGDDAVKRLNQDLSNITAITDTVYFDVAMGGGPAQRVVVGLYGLAAPRAVKSVVAMAECSNPKYCYKDSVFHRVIADFIVQGGDVAKGDGTGTLNIYNRPYADEVYALGLMHDRAGVVQMANAGADTNGGQFVFMVAAAPHLNGNHVVVGRILSGLDHVMEISKTGVDEQTSKPIVEVKLSACGRIK
eukprot:CAMPEP_0175128852 /NCGR_PEP_ID=MMETSP0087-20121206/5155_1 /TAXON_ID=136419 /ORGANISM="Unknown Unknown, Strain D1" /LENGTH=381 /DNA_ID=CAMNT_0016410953 /DNA_START=30 /DNA_END=1175 /DNA_ORIENTATION=+